jgi:putative MATE family efflux protein
MEQQQMTDKNPLGYAPIGRLMLQFSIPSIITQVVSSLYNVVDQIFIGQGVGYLGNAATNVIFPFAILAMAVSFMLGDGGAAFMNLNLGQGNKFEASKSVGNVVAASLVSGVALTAVCLVFLEPLCRLLGATDDSISYALDYGSIIAIGFVFTNFANSVSALIRADGSPRYSMAVMISGAITNTILDPLFIFGFGWGVKGAAWATIIGQVVSAVLCVSYFARFKHIDFKLSRLKIELKTIGRICALGISSFITLAVVCLVVSLVNNTLVFRGSQSIYGADIPLAAFGITMKINQIIMSVCIGIAAGCAPIISFNYGARQTERVRKTVMRCIVAAVAIMAFATVWYEFFPQYIARIFGSESELYERFSVRTFRIYLCFSVLNGFQVCSGLFFQAIGKPLQSLVISLSRQLLFFVPLMLLMSFFMGIDGILWAGPAGDGLAFLLALPLVLVQFGKFKNGEIIHVKS